MLASVSRIVLGGCRFCPYIQFSQQNTAVLQEGEAARNAPQIIDII